MTKSWCNPENFTGNEAHYAHRSSFDWIIVDGMARWFCDDCRYDIEQLQEEEYEAVHSQ